MNNVIKNTELIDVFMENVNIIINIPFAYQFKEELPVSGNICNTIEDAENEVRGEIEEGIINSIDVLLEVPKYHTSWNLLMPVVGKIGECEYAGGITYDVQNTLLVADIEKTYKAVVEFIEWYNKKKLELMQNE